MGFGGQPAFCHELRKMRDDGMVWQKAGCAIERRKTVNALINKHLPGTFKLCIHIVFRLQAAIIHQHAKKHRM
jgi:hypothetical protein